MLMFGARLLLIAALLCIAAAIPLPLGGERPPTANVKYVSDPNEMTEFDQRRGTSTRQPKIVDLAVAAANLTACEEEKGPEAADLLASGSYTAGAIQDSNGNWVDVVRPQLPSSRREAAAAPPAEVQTQPVENPAPPPQAQPEAVIEPPSVEKMPQQDQQPPKETKEAKEAAKQSVDDMLPMHLMSKNNDDGSLDDGPAPAFSKSATPQGDEKLFFDWLPWRRQGAPEFDKQKDKGNDGISKEEAKNKEELDFRTERVANQNKLQHDEEKQEKQEEADKQKLAAHKRNLVNKKLPSSESTEGSRGNIAADLQHREARASLGNKLKDEEQQADAKDSKSNSASKIKTKEAKTETKKDEEVTKTETKKDKEETKTETKKDKEETKTETKKDKEETKTETKKDKEETKTETKKDKEENKKDKEETKTETKDKEEAKTETKKDKEETDSESKTKAQKAAEAIADAKSDKLSAPGNFDYNAFAKDSYAAINERKKLMENYARQRFDLQLAAAKKNQQAQEAAAAIAMARRSQLVNEDFQSRQAIAEAMRNGQII